MAASVWAPAAGVDGAMRRAAAAGARAAFRVRVCTGKLEQGKVREREEERAARRAPYRPRGRGGPAARRAGHRRHGAGGTVKPLCATGGRQPFL